MKLSIVIPAYNEADNILSTLEKLATVLAEASDLVTDHEILVIDDHSSDGTFALLAGHPDKRLRTFRLSRRSGSHTALRVGLDHAEGDAVLCMSADGQDAPEAIPEMLNKWRTGKHIVWALRRNRQDEPLLLRWTATLFYKILTFFGEVRSEIDLSRADFYLLDKKVVAAVTSCKERNTSLFGLIVWLGFAQDSVEYDRRQRTAGRSKWNFRSRMDLAKNWIIAFSGLPLRLITLTGSIVACLGFLYAMVILVRNLFYGSPMLGWPSVMTAILVLGGAQMIMLGIIGEYLWRNLDESRKRPIYFIEQSYPE